MSVHNRLSVGDRVRVRSSMETEKLGLAGVTGEIRGQSMPSATGVEMLGTSITDRALYVAFPQRNTAMWIAPDLLEKVEAASAGDSSAPYGVPTAWSRPMASEVKEPAVTAKPWWKFWM